MTGWNLPPGCSVNDIPGEDEAEEAFAEALEAKLAARSPALKLPEDWQNTDLWDLVVIARDLGFNEGFGQGKDDAIISMQPDPGVMEDNERLQDAINWYVQERERYFRREPTAGLSEAWAGLQRLARKRTPG